MPNPNRSSDDLGLDAAAAAGKAAVFAGDDLVGKFADPADPAAAGEPGFDPEAALVGEEGGLLCEGRTILRMSFFCFSASINSYLKKKKKKNNS
jgi:hypothetical protein